MTALNETPVVVGSGGLQLDGLLHEGHEASASAVVLHPHPQHGGDMRNIVVGALCETLAARGMTTLRFNFREAGGSEERFDHGQGEAEDARAAIGMIRERCPGAAPILCGYSFGAMIAAAIASDAAPAAMVLVSPPVAHMALAPLPDSVPALLIAGERDEHCPGERLRAMASEQHRVVVVAHADHFWMGGVRVMTDEVARFLGDVL